MTPTLVINVVGLTPELLGAQTPELSRFALRGAMKPVSAVLPAVTCSVQATYLTGLLPCDHGIVGNGWYFKDLSEILFWRQSNRLVRGETVWEAAKLRDARFTCAQMFWWYNMYSSADFSVTPRPLYPADGRKIPDVYSNPPELRTELTERLGTFPLFQFWGPAAGIVSTRWIVDATLYVMATRKPTLTLAYLPHLDYGLQKWGPQDPRLAAELRAVDAEAGRLIRAAEAEGRRVVVLSEYGIAPVQRPIHINRALRAAGWLRIKDELGRDTLDAGASEAFAVADHQIAHVYVRDPSLIGAVKDCLRALDGVDLVLDREGQKRWGLEHERSGDLVAVAAEGAWFTYYFWNEDARAPDYARTVDIHRKPGYDPVELFLDPGQSLVKLKILWRLLQKKLGFRALMDVIPLDATLVKGSHGRPTDVAEHGPLLITSAPALISDRPTLLATDVKDLLIAHIFS